MRALLRFLLLLAALLLLSFALPRALPGDPLTPVSAGNGQDAPIVLSAQTRARLMAYYGLDQPLPQQFAHFLSATAHGDLGYSISFNRPVVRLLADRLPWTLLLVGCSMLIAATLGSLLGVLSAWQHAERGQQPLAAALLLLGSLPDFVVGIGLILLFAVSLPLLPLSGARTPFQSCAGPAGLAGCTADVARHAALPVLTLAAAQLSAFFLLMRAATLGELGQPYLLAARARGLDERTVALRHAGRNAVLPVISLLGLRLGALLGGVVIVETLFGYPGIGQLTFQATLARDFPLVQPLVLLGGVAILLLNTAADLLRERLDPRLRLEPAS